MCTFLSISYKDVLIRVLLFTYFKMYCVYVQYMAHSNVYLHIHILLYSVLAGLHFRLCYRSDALAIALRFAPYFCSFLRSF